MPQVRDLIELVRLDSLQIVVLPELSTARQAPAQRCLVSGGAHTWQVALN